MRLPSRPLRKCENTIGQNALICACRVQAQRFGPTGLGKSAKGNAAGFLFRVLTGRLTSGRLEIQIAIHRPVENAICVFDYSALHDSARTELRINVSGCCVSAAKAQGHPPIDTFCDCGLQGKIV